MSECRNGHLTKYGTPGCSVIGLTRMAAADTFTQSGVLAAAVETRWNRVRRPLALGREVFCVRETGMHTEFEYEYHERQAIMRVQAKVVEQALIP